MVWPQLLRVATAILFACPVFMPVQLPTSKCTGGSLTEGTCVSGSTDKGGVTLSGSKNKAGKGGGKGKTESAHDKCVRLHYLRCDIVGIIPPGGKGNPAITINDLRHFPAFPGTDHMEPNGWMVVGLNTNFYSVVGTELVNGTLLGNPATVRFTPESWHWTYGDGTSSTRTTAGRTWAAQRIPDFDATPTSHVYSRPGTYYIDLDITFRAEYRYAGGPWIPVVGTVTLPANRLKATAGSAKTVLVNRDCAQNPTGPGC